MSSNELIFCPLGGSGQIGGNMNLYAYGKNENQKWIIVDTGVSFADDSVPGIDLIYPDRIYYRQKGRFVRNCLTMPTKIILSNISYLARFKMQYIRNTIHRCINKRKI